MGRPFGRPNIISISQHVFQVNQNRCRKANFSLLQKTALFLLGSIPYWKNQDPVLSYRHRGDTNVHVNLQDKGFKKLLNKEVFKFVIWRSLRRSCRKRGFKDARY
jgi:hypothetical protein